MMNSQDSRILSVRQLAEDPNYPFTEASLRAHIFNASDRKSSSGTIPGNGLADAIIRKGRRLFIVESRFKSWLDRENN